MPSADYEAMPDVDLLALCDWREARGEGLIGRRGVAHSVVNRAKNPSWWGHDIHTVILHPSQYSSFNNGDPNESKFPNPDEPEDFQAYQEIHSICESILSGNDEDVTGGACWYIDSSIAPPKWTEKLEISLRCGRITFYREPRPSPLVQDPEIGM